MNASPRLYRRPFGLLLAVVFFASIAEVSAQTTLSEIVKKPVEVLPLARTLRFSPHIGAGRTSDQSQIRHSNGFRISSEWDLAELAGFRFGPHLQIANTYVNTRLRKDFVRTSNYDHRIFNAGLSVARSMSSISWLGVDHELRANISAGYVSSKLGTDFSSAGQFRQYNQTAIVGDAHSAELIASFLIRESFSLDFGFIASYLRLDQSRATGTFESESVTEAGTFLSGGTYADSDPSYKLEPTVWQKLYLGTVGVSLRF